MEKEFKHDPENYHKMSEPHESSDKANEALKLFYDKVSEARNECKMADVLIVVKDSVKYSDGKIGGFLHQMQFGNQSNGVSMAAYAYGQLQYEEKELINKLLSGKK